MANLTLRIAKGSPLTNAEVDGNFSALNTELVGHIGSTGDAHGVATDTVDGFMSAADKVKLDTVSLDDLSLLNGATGNIQSQLDSKVSTTPAAGDIGIRFDAATGKFEGFNGTEWIAIGSGSGASGIVVETDQVISSNYTLTAGKNAASVGPVAVADGAAVTVPNGAVWTIV